MDSGARYLLVKPVIGGHPFRNGIRQQTSKVGFPIRKSADQSLFAAPHGLSQRTTSFIACACQGIHRTPFCHFIALIINARRSGTPASGRSERRTRGISYLDLKEGQAARRPRTACGREPPIEQIGRSGKTSVTRELPVGRGGLSARPACAQPPGRPGGGPDNSSLHDVSQQAAPRHRRIAAKDLLSTSPDKADGGARRDRTDDLMLAKHALSQLSYGPFGPSAPRMVSSE